MVNYIVPAGIMHFAVPKDSPEPTSEVVVMKRGARRIMAVFGLTRATAVSFHNFRHLPPMLGMMTGLAYLQFFSFYLKKSFSVHESILSNPIQFEKTKDDKDYDVFHNVARSEWDTLLFLL